MGWAVLGPRACRQAAFARASLRFARLAPSTLNTIVPVARFFATETLEKDVAKSCNPETQHTARTQHLPIYSKLLQIFNERPGNVSQVPCTRLVNDKATSPNHPKGDESVGLKLLQLKGPVSSFDSIDSASIQRLNQSTPEKADSLFTYLMQSPIETNTRPRYYAFLHFYARQGNYRQVELLARKLLQEHNVVEPESYSSYYRDARRVIVHSLLHAYKQSGQYRRALEYFRSCFPSLLKPDDATFTILAHVCAGADEWSYAIDFLKTWATENRKDTIALNLNTSNYNADQSTSPDKTNNIVEAFISAFCAEQKLIGALEIAKQYKEFVTDRGICLLLEASGKSSDLSALGRLCSLFKDQIDPHQPFVFKSYMRALSTSGQFIHLLNATTQALNVGDGTIDSLEFDLESGHDFYIAQLLGCASRPCKGANKGSNQTKGTTKYSAITKIKAAQDEEGSLDSASLGLSMDPHDKFDMRVSNQITDTFEMMGIFVERPHSIMDFLNKLFTCAQRDTLPRSERVYESLIVCLSRHRLLNESIQSLALAIDRSIIIPVTVCNSILSTCLRLEQSTMGLQLLNLMRQQNMLENALTIVLHIQILSQLHHDEDVLEMYGEYFPTLRSNQQKKYAKAVFSAVISSATRLRDTDFASTLASDMGRLGLKPQDFQKHTSYYEFQSLVHDQRNNSSILNRLDTMPSKSYNVNYDDFQAEENTHLS